MRWEIGRGDKARVAVGRSCAHAEHGNVRTNEKGDEEGSCWNNGRELEVKSGEVPSEVTISERDFPCVVVKMMTDSTSRERGRIYCA